MLSVTLKRKVLSLILCSWVKDSPQGGKRRDSRQGTDSVFQHFDEDAIYMC